VPALLLSLLHAELLIDDELLHKLRPEIAENEMEKVIKKL